MIKVCSKNYIQNATEFLKIIYTDVRLINWCGVLTLENPRLIIKKRGESRE